MAKSESPVSPHVDVRNHICYHGHYGRGVAAASLSPAAKGFTEERWFLLDATLPSLQNADQDGAPAKLAIARSHADDELTRGKADGGPVSAPEVKRLQLALILVGPNARAWDSVRDPVGPGDADMSVCRYCKGPSDRFVPANVLDDKETKTASCQRCESITAGRMFSCFQFKREFVERELAKPPKDQGVTPARIRAYMAEHGCPRSKAIEDLEIIHKRSIDGRPFYAGTPVSRRRSRRKRR